ncbi:MAG: hypothetical protein FJ010_04870 [Chloroflexi bacterium]|nr:hypothetical protein [Chloroflexota bacterium]
MTKAKRTFEAETVTLSAIRLENTSQTASDWKSRLPCEPDASLRSTQALRRSKTQSTKVDFVSPPRIYSMAELIDKIIERIKVL